MTARLPQQGTNLGYAQCLDQLLHPKCVGEVVLISEDKAWDAVELRLIQQCVQLLLGRLQLACVGGIHHEPALRPDRLGEGR